MRLTLSLGLHMAKWGGMSIGCGYFCMVQYRKISRRYLENGGITVKKRAGLLLAIVALMTLLCVVPIQAKTQVIVWGLNPLQVGSGNKEMIDAFNESHPDIELVPQSTPGTNGYATQDVAKLLAAIASGNPPDVTWLDRFTAAQFASRGALMAIDNYVEMQGFDVNNYYDYTINELRFNGQIWGLPWDTDTRPMYWNKEVFREVGLDPEAPPKTWDDLMLYSEKITRVDENGKFQRIGYIPGYGNTWLYLYGYANGAQFLSEDGRTALLNEPELVEALEYVVSFYESLGGTEKVAAYQSTFQGETNDPFLTGQVGMLVTVNNATQGYARYNPDLDYGSTLPPAPAGKPQTTWSGGWSYAIPRGAKHPAEAFEVIRWLTTEGIKVKEAGAAAYTLQRGSQYHIPFPAAYQPSNDYLVDKYVHAIDNDVIKNAVLGGLNAIEHSKARPVSPVGEVLWVELARANDRAIYGEMSPKQALDYAQRVVQRELDKFWRQFDREN